MGTITTPSRMPTLAERAAAYGRVPITEIPPTTQRTTIWAAR